MNVNMQKCVKITQHLVSSKFKSLTVSATDRQVCCLMGRRLSLLMTSYILEQSLVHSEEQLLTSKTWLAMPQLHTVRHRSLLNWNLSSISQMHSLFCCMAVRRGDWRERMLLQDLKCSTVLHKNSQEFIGGQKHLMSRYSDTVNNEQL